MSSATPRLSFAGGTLLLAGMTPTTVRQVFDPQPWTWDSRVGAWRCDAIEYLSVRRSLQRNGWTFAGTTTNTITIPLGYAHQVDGQTMIPEPTAGRPVSWGQIKRKYR